MSLIDRYLQAVRSHLPSTRQDDIIRELSEDLRAQVSEQEEALGRPLTEGEEEAFLRKLGHPLMLAARYRPHQHLIGSATFPIYWQTLKVALIGAFGVQVALVVASVVAGRPASSFIGPLVTFPFGIAMTVFGWVTLVFALIDFNMQDILSRSGWSPRHLPAVGRQPPWGRWQLLAEIVFSTAFLLWWLAVPRYPFLIFGPGAAFLTLAPVWHTMHLAIAGLWAIGLASLWAFLIRPDWARFRSVGRLLTDGIGLVVAIVLYRANEVVALAPGVAATPDMIGTIDLLNRLLHLCLLVAMAGTSWQILRGVYRWMTSGPDVQ
jgi:hypothetical protein